MSTSEPPARPLALPPFEAEFATLATPNGNGDRGPSLRSLSRRIASRRLLLASLFVLGFTPIAIYTFLATPRYRSAASLRIETKSPGGGGLADQLTSAVPAAGLLGLGRDELETEIAVLSSDRIEDATIDSLALGVRVETPPDNRARVITARTVDPQTDVDGTITLTQERPGHYRVEKQKLEEVRSLPASIAAGDSIRVGGAEVTLSTNLARGGPDKIVIRFLPRYQVHKLLAKRLLIAQQEGGSRLVDVTYEDPDRWLAEQVVARIIAEYTAYTTRTEESQDTTTVGKLRNEVDSTSRQLAVAETNLRAFQERSRLIAPEDQATAQVKRITAISTAVDQLSVERNALARVLAIIDQKARGGADPEAYRQLATFPSLITNKGIQDLLLTLVDLENKRSELGVRRTEANPDYKALTDRITAIETQLHQVGTQYLESLDQQLATTVGTVTALSDTLEAMPGAAMQYGRLVRDRTVLEATYLALEKQLKAAELTDVLRQERVRIVDAPRVANVKDKVFPNKPVMLVLGVIFGAAFALTVALFLELWSAEPMPFPEPHRQTA